MADESRRQDESTVGFSVSGASLAEAIEAALVDLFRSVGSLSQAEPSSRTVSVNVRRRSEGELLTALVDEIQGLQEMGERLDGSVAVGGVRPTGTGWSAWAAIGMASNATPAVGVMPSVGATTVRRTGGEVIIEYGILP